MDAIALISTGPLVPAALFAASRLVDLGSPARVVLFTDSPHAFALAQHHDLPCEVRDMPAPAEFAGNPLMQNPLYFRFAIPHILAGEYRRTFYLDVDTFVEDDRLFRLFDLDMKGHAIAAVRDYHMAFVRPKERQATLGAGNRKYLNAGVMLIDNQRFVEQAIVSAVLKIADARAGSLELFDQSALNIVLQGNWLELSPSFNMLPQAWVSFVRKVYDPVLVHFAGIAKPWEGPRFGLDHRSASEMRRFFSSPPWQALVEACVPAETREAWLGGLRQDIQGYDQFFFGKSRLVSLLHQAPFADVQQGLTTPHREFLP
jgi:lipopolysaccharide biosynthesis glycosyltransferase